MAHEHWMRRLPRRYQTIPDPASFFSTLGEEAAAEIAQLWPELSGQGPPGEEYLARVGRFNMAKMQAEGRVLAAGPPGPGTGGRRGGDGGPRADGLDGRGERCRS